MCVWKALAGIESHCLQLVRPPLLLSAAVRKSNAPLFPRLDFCHSPPIMSSMPKRNDDLVVVNVAGLKTEQTEEKS